MRKIPDSEFGQRQERVRGILRDKKLDGAFVYYDELHFSAGWYLSGWCPQFESGAIVVPTDGEASILGGPESEPFAQLDSRIKKTYNVSVFMVPEEEYPYAVIHTMRSALEDAMGSVPRRLGIVGLDVMPLLVFNRLREEFPETEVIDITVPFEKLREIKSPAELAVMREAFRINEQGYFAMKEAIKPGIPEYVVAAAGEHRARELGANGFSFRTVVASGPRAAGVIPIASERLLEEGEYVMIGLSTRLDGYATVSGDTIPVGQVDPSLKEHRANLLEAFKIAREQLVPGRSAAEIDAPVRAFLEKKGYAAYQVCPYFHTQGLNEADHPFFGPKSKDHLEAGMVIAIDVSLFGHPQFHGGRFETVYAITDSGAEALAPGVEAALLH